MAVFDAFEAKLGEAVTTAFSNATAVLPSGALVPGIYTRAPAPGVGGVGMQSRELSFVCRTAALAEPVAKGTLLTIGSEALKVAGRTDWLQTADTELGLELP